MPVHRLRPNETVWSPPSVIFLDSETRWERTEKAELHRLRLWAACHVDRRGTPKRFDMPAWGWGETADELAGWINGRMVGRDCVWLYAHNLNFDLVVTRLVDMMGEVGWVLKDCSVGQGPPWLRLGKRSKTLTVCDSWSWLPESLESLATRMGTGKRPLPENVAGMGEWFARCASDVELLARAVLSLMDWWDEQKLGRWTISGAGSGWNAMRHVRSAQRHVIDPEPELVSFDRLAIRGGRKDAAFVRATTGGPFAELDMESTHATICRELRLPFRRGRLFDSLPLDAIEVDGQHVGPIAECLIRCDTPRYPVRWRGVTWFPVGTFRTVLAGPEIAWARENGDLITIGRGQMHRLGLSLQDWAGWVLDPTWGGTAVVPPVGYMACRYWGRAVPGKFAGHRQKTTELDDPAPPGWSSRDMWDGTVGRRGAELRIGGKSWLVAYDGDSENAYPAVLAWIESAVRVRLGRVLEAVEGNWWVCDTDGLIVDLAHSPRWIRSKTISLAGRSKDPLAAAEALCEALAPLVTPLRLRPKRVFDGMDVIGPQHTTAGRVPKLAGVAKGAVEVEPRRFVSLDWPGIRWQMSNSTPGIYRRPERVSTFRAPVAHRWVLDNGETRPVEFAAVAGGAAQPLAWSESRWARAGDVLTEQQYAGLAGLH